MPIIRIPITAKMKQTIESNSELTIEQLLTLEALRLYGVDVDKKPKKKLKALAAKLKEEGSGAGRPAKRDDEILKVLRDASTPMTGTMIGEAIGVETSLNATLKRLASEGKIEESDKPTRKTSGPGRPARWWTLSS